METFVRAIMEFPLDERVGEEIERLAGDIDGGWDRLGNAYADVLDMQPDPAVQRAIGHRQARVFEKELEQIDNAIGTYRYLLGVDPLDTDSLMNLDRIFLALERWAELGQVLEQRIVATSDPVELLELHWRLGPMYEDKLQQVDDAIRVYRRIFDELEPAHEEAILALKRLYAQKQAWGDGVI